MWISGIPRRSELPRISGISRILDNKDTMDIRYTEDIGNNKDIRSLKLFIDTRNICEISKIRETRMSGKAIIMGILSISEISRKSGIPSLSGTFLKLFKLP